MAFVFRDPVFGPTCLIDLATPVCQTGTAILEDDSFSVTKLECIYLYLEQINLK